MTINVSSEVENSIHAAVRSGRFASVDEAMDQAARLLLRQLELEAQPEKTFDATATMPHRKPIWERAAELRKRVPAEEWDRLPADGSTQLDHYIYGSPKRPTT